MNKPVWRSCMRPPMMKACVTALLIKRLTRMTLLKPVGMDRSILSLAGACVPIFLKGILIVVTKLPLVVITVR